MILIFREFHFFQEPKEERLPRSTHALPSLGYSSSSPDTLEFYINHDLNELIVFGLKNCLAF